MNNDGFHGKCINIFWRSIHILMWMMIIMATVETWVYKDSPREILWTLIFVLPCVFCITRAHLHTSDAHLQFDQCIYICTAELGMIMKYIFLQKEHLLLTLWTILLFLHISVSCHLLLGLPMFDELHNHNFYPNTISNPKNPLRTSIYYTSLQAK